MSNDSLPKKSLGQHWLNDEATLDAMCDAVDVGAGDVVLEIGPGQGSLTRKLVSRAKQVISVEKDEQLYKKLVKSHPADNLQLICSDILSLDLSNLTSGYKVVANIPYYLTSKLLRKLCESDNPFSQAALLVQKEVAQRVYAGPGDMSLLSVSVQFYCEVQLRDIVPAYLFDPPPKVDSQILYLNYKGAKFQDVDTGKFFDLVRAGFSERRKKLRSSLSGGLHISKAEAEELLNQAGIDPNLRAQELSLDDWHKLYLTYYS